MIERGHSLAVTHQCELLALSRSSVYHQPAPVSEQDLEAMRLLDEEKWTPSVGQGSRINKCLLPCS